MKNIYTELIEIGLRLIQLAQEQMEQNYPAIPSSVEFPKCSCGQYYPYCCNNTACPNMMKVPD